MFNSKPEIKSLPLSDQETHHEGFEIKVNFFRYEAGLCLDFLERQPMLKTRLFQNKQILGFDLRWGRVLKKHEL